MRIPGAGAGVNSEASTNTRKLAHSCQTLEEITAPQGIVCFDLYRESRSRLEDNYP